MGFEVWYPQDIQNILNALASAGELQGPEYHKALGDVALAFGVPARCVTEGRVLAIRADVSLPVEAGRVSCLRRP